MGFYELIILSLYYPQFYSPINSRFESFFHSLKKKEKKIINSNKKLYKSKKYFLKRLQEMKIKGQVL
jgi:hypothetical protein